MHVLSFNSCRRSGCHPIAQWIGSLWPDGHVFYCHDNHGHVTDYIEEGRIKPIIRLIQDASRKPVGTEFAAKLKAGENPDFFDLDEQEGPGEGPGADGVFDTGELLNKELPPDRVIRMGEFPEGGVLIFGTENRTPQSLSISMPFTRPILNIRDPFNMWASAVRYSRNVDKRPLPRQRALPNNRRQPAFLIPPEYLGDLWCAYAREYLGITNFMGEKIRVNYNDWHESLDYRRELATQLGREFTDRGKDEIPLAGLGSSFDGRRKVDRDYLNRWKTMLRDERFYRVIRANLSLFEYAHQIWPDLTEEVADALGIDRVGY